MKPKVGGVRDQHSEIGVETMTSQQKQPVLGPKSSGRQEHLEALDRAHDAPDTLIPVIFTYLPQTVLPACRLPHDTQGQWQGQATGSQWVGRPEPL